MKKKIGSFLISFFLLFCLLLFFFGGGGCLFGVFLHLWMFICVFLPIDIYRQFPSTEKVIISGTLALARKIK